MGASDKNDGLALAGQAAAGDPRAQRQLVDRFYRRVQTIAFAIIGNAPDAEDCTQAILMEILESVASYRGEDLPTWGDRIAVRMAIRLAYQRRIRGMRSRKTDTLGELPLTIESTDPFDRDPRDLREYLARLSEAYRVVLVLRHMMDYSIEEIAELTDVSPNTVKDRLLHAREQLRPAIRGDRLRGGTVLAIADDG